ncbi:MAG: nucleotidyltransferase domain-containing protein [Candidatus Aenigmatarchaeota archaeon]
MVEKSLGKKIKKFSLETRLKSSEEFKNKLLNMFKDYIKSVIVWGSITRGDFTGKSDIDIYVIFDDTKMPLKKFEEIREKIDKDIYSLASSIDPRLHPQPVLALTEFIKGIRYTHPLFFNIIREGYAIYDTGFFIPMRKLLEWGEFPITPESAHMRIDSVPGRIKRVKNVKLYMIAEDLYYAMLDTAQAVLMYIGVGPPVPKRAAEEVRKHLVDSGLLEEEYAKMLEDVVDFRKKVEHKEIKDISGQEVDKWIEKAEKYVERFEKLLKDLETKRKEEDIKRNYEVMVQASVAALKSLKKLPSEPEKLPEAFKKYLVESGLINPIYSEVFEKVIRMRKMLEDKKIDKITEREIYNSKEYVRRFLNDIKGLIKPEKEKRTKKK